MAATVTLLSQSAIAAPVPMDDLKKLPKYYPVVPGTVWEYEMGETTQKIRVTDSKKDDEDVIRGSLGTIVEDRETASEGFKVDETGVYRTRIPGLTFSPPILLLKFGIKDGEEWTTKTGEYIVKCKLDGQEEIKVPAGTYKAIKVSHTTEHNGKIVNAATSYYSEGVGLVKIHYKLGDAEAILSLKKFKLGKEAKK